MSILRFSEQNNMEIWIKLTKKSAIMTLFELHRSDLGKYEAKLLSVRQESPLDCPDAGLPGDYMAAICAPLLGGVEAGDRP